MRESRTRKNFRNSIVALAFFAIEFVLKFYSRKVFLDFLGTEILGLNTTAVNLLQFLNLAELGIGAAVGFSLYGPLHYKDYDKVCEIVTLQGHFYRRIAYAVIAGAAVVMCFFPLIFSKMTLPLWYAYGSFAVLLYSALLGYFVNYKQIVLASSQLDYKISLSTRTWNIVMIVCQMLAVSMLPHPYVWWLALQVLFSSMQAITLHRTTMRSFPWLHKAKYSFKALRARHSMVLTKVRQIFVHRIAGVALTETSPFIIYLYLSLTTVTYYGNYVLVTGGIISLLNAIFNSMGAGIGDLIAEGNKERIYAVFEEIFSIRFFIGCFVTYAFVAFAQPFMSIWLGSEYILPYSTVVIIAARMYIIVTRNTVDTYLAGYGIFHDVWAPVAETAINVGLSLLLGYYFGLNGILIGVIVSLVSIVGIWKPILLYRDGFKRNISEYVWLYAKHVAIGAAAWMIAHWSLRIWNFDPAAGWGPLIEYGVVSMATFGTLLALGLCLMPGFRAFLRRLR